MKRACFLSKVTPSYAKTLQHRSFLPYHGEGHRRQTRNVLTSPSPEVLVSMKTKPDRCVGMEERRRDALEEKWKMGEKEKQGTAGKEIINF